MRRLPDVSVFWGVILGELASVATLAAVCGWNVALVALGMMLLILAGALVYVGWWLHTWSDRNGRPLRRQERDVLEEEPRVRPADL
jgi:uncharacterized membrane protein